MKIKKLWIISLFGKAFKINCMGVFGFCGIELFRRGGAKSPLTKIVLLRIKFFLEGTPYSTNF